MPFRLPRKVRDNTNELHYILTISSKSGVHQSLIKVLFLYSCLCKMTRSSLSCRNLPLHWNSTPQLNSSPGPGLDGSLQACWSLPLSWTSPVSFSISIRYFTMTCQHEACFASKTQTKSYQLWLQLYFFLTFGIATCLNYNIPNTYKEEKVPDGIIVTNNINKTEFSNIAFKI